MIKYATNLQSILDLHLSKTNLNRKKMMCALILAILERKSVKFPELAEELNEAAKDESNLRRIQTFFAGFDFDYYAFSRLMLSFVPHLRLDVSIDRTNWKFGAVDFNILTLTVGYKGIGLPILFEMLDKKGNSNQKERKALLDQFLDLFGSNRIGSLCADREFVGDEWFKYLIDNKIPFYVRLRKSTRIDLCGILYRVDTLSEICRTNKQAYVRNVQINGMGGLLLGLKKLPAGNKNKDAQEDYLAVITNQIDKKPLQEYRKRWSIEVFFQSVKKRGVDIEQTHLTDPIRLKKLFTLVSVAFAMCLHIGIRHDECVKTIEVKNHGYKQNSFFKVGVRKLSKAIKALKTDSFALKSMIQCLFDHLFKIASTLNLFKKIIT